MQGIILCGGKGTRLRSVIGEKQKTMTETNGEPFVVNILKYLKRYGVDDIIFATGYKSDEVEKYFGTDYYFGQKITYSKETEPLGTGGAIRNSLSLITKDRVIVVNGDTLFPVNIKFLDEIYEDINADMVIACKEIDDKSRYGSIYFKKIITDDNDNNYGEIEKFAEKTNDGNKNSQYINGGVYIIKKELIDEIEANINISLENDLMPRWLEKGKKIVGVVSKENFIDIGTPESLADYKKRFDEWN